VDTDQVERKACRYTDYLSHATTSIMFAPYRNPSQTYRNIDVETGLANADPHRLIVLLYDGAIAAIAQAKGHMAKHEVAAKGKSIGKAIQIVDEGLKAAVDVKAGGTLALNLRELYDYMVRRLVHANLKNDAGALDEVSRLLNELRDAWLAIAPVRAEAQPMPASLAAVG
jgi:flagellar protein FliS